MNPFDAAVQYHVDCELYDRNICTGPMGKDGILSANFYEQGLINRNAIERRLFYARKARMLVTDFDEIIRDNTVINESIRLVRELV